jgi:hypothetical protein
MTRRDSIRTIVLLTIIAFATALATSAQTMPEFRAGHTRGGPVPPGADPFMLAATVGEVCASASSGVNGEGDCIVSDFRREVITRLVAHYSFKVRFGPGPYDVFGLHRIVKEAFPFHPSRPRDAILLLHGDIQGFEGGFLGNLRSPGASADLALPVYLAQRGVDVWGIDQGWTLVPKDETDVSWAEGWGFDKELDQLGLAVGIARGVRGVTGNGAGPIPLLGWSRGAQVVLAYANAETQLPPHARTVSGYVYADVWNKFTDPELKQASCEEYDRVLALISSGDFADPTGGLFVALGALAVADPLGDSPIFLCFTNETAALVFGSVPFGSPTAPNYHLCAGVFGADGLPIGLQFTDERLFYDWLTGASAYEPVQILVDGEAIGCERDDVPWDDHLAEITAPILYLEAAGGAGGDYGRQILPFLPNADVTELIVQLYTDEERALDYGHVDLWTADNAQMLVWRPILNWIRQN